MWVDILSSETIGAVELHCPALMGGEGKGWNRKPSAERGGVRLTNDVEEQELQPRQPVKL